MIVDLTIIIPIVVLLIIVIPIVVGVLLSRGKQLKCPDCGCVFNTPIMDKKTMGFGLTFPYLGIVKCPKCGIKRSRCDYDKIEKIVKKHNFPP